MKARKILCTIMALVLMLSIAAGCKRQTANPSTSVPPSAAPSDSADPGKTTPGSPDVVSQGVTDDTVKIATAGLLGGAFAYIGQPAYDGMRACIERFNAVEGGVLGRKVEVISFDDQYDAATGKAYIERLVEQDKVFAFCSLFGNIVEPCLDYLKEKNIPVINISSGLDVCYSANGGGNLYQVQPANMTDARNLITRVLHEHIFGPNKDEKLPDDAIIGVVHGTDSASMDNLAHLKEYAEQEGAADRLMAEAVTVETYASAIQKFKNSGVSVIIFMGLDATTWISAMDDAQFEVPVVFSYGASTLQSFVPDTYKPTRPCYATIRGDYSGKAGQDMLDDMIDALSYLTDVDEATRVSYRDNNYCVAGYAYGMVLVQALRRYNEHEGEYGLNWDDFSKIMELDDFSFGSVSFNYKDGKRMGIDSMAFVEYVGNPETGEEKMIPLRGFETIEEIRAK